MSDEYKSLVPDDATLKEIRESKKDIIKKHYAHYVYDFEGQDVEGQDVEVYFKDKKDVDLPELRDNINRTIRIRNEANYNKLWYYYLYLFVLITIAILNIVGLIIANKKSDDSIEDETYLNKLIYGYYKNSFWVSISTVAAIALFFSIEWDDGPGIALIFYPISWVFIGLITT